MPGTTLNDVIMALLTDCDGLHKCLCSQVFLFKSLVVLSLVVYAAHVEPATTEFNSTAACEYTHW